MNVLITFIVCLLLLPLVILFVPIVILFVYHVFIGIKGPNLFKAIYLDLMAYKQAISEKT